MKNTCLDELSLAKEIVNKCPIFCGEIFYFADKVLYILKKDNKSPQFQNRFNYFIRIDLKPFETKFHIKRQTNLLQHFIALETLFQQEFVTLLQVFAQIKILATDIDFNSHGNLSRCPLRLFRYDAGQKRGG